MISYLFGACKFAFRIGLGVAYVGQFDVVDGLAPSAIASGSAVNCYDHAFCMCRRAHAIAGLVGTIGHRLTSLCDNHVPDHKSSHLM